MAILPCALLCTWYIAGESGAAPEGFSELPLLMSGGHADLKVFTNFHELIIILRMSLLTEAVI